MKKFNVQENVGRCRYVVNFHDGEKKHPDGSEFYDIRIFKNKDKMGAFIMGLIFRGYVQEGTGEI